MKWTSPYSLSTVILLFAVSMLQLQPSVEQQTNFDPLTPEPGEH